MKSINRVTFLGHIVADPQLKTTKNQKRVVTYAIATNNEWLDSEGELKKSVDFHRVVAWDKLADICSKYLHKGTPVYLEGRLTNRSYEGNDHMTHYITEVVAQSVTLLEWHQGKQTVEMADLEDTEVEVPTPVASTRARSKEKALATA